MARCHRRRGSVRGVEVLGCLTLAELAGMAGMMGMAGMAGMAAGAQRLSCRFSLLCCRL